MKEIGFNLQLLLISIFLLMVGGMRARKYTLPLMITCGCTVQEVGSQVYLRYEDLFYII